MRLAWSCMLPFLVAGQVAAQAPVIVPVRADVPPRVDGRLDDGIWQRAPFSGEFRQRAPREGAAASQPTQFAVAFDDDALYVAIRAEAAAATLRRGVTWRDDAGDVDHVLISVDPHRDRRTAYTFGVTAAGVRLDHFHARDDVGARDATFDPVWDARVAHDSAGWTAEMRIPFSQLRLSGRTQGSWGINAQRVTPALQETSLWAFVSRTQAGWSSRFGELRLEPALSGGGLELRPYARMRAQRAGENDGSDAAFGGDVHTRLGALGMDVTINPDFGQIEADPATINLSAFETGLSERRPFFTEGARDLAASPYYYSRRIGALPPAGGSSLLERPREGTILGAARVAGRTRAGLSIAGLIALTDHERALAIDSSRHVLVAPRTVSALARVRREVGQGGVLGFVATGVHRNLDDDLRHLPRGAQAFGADWSLPLGEAFLWTGDVGFSNVHGDALALSALQTSSARYFQRPDADHLEYDPARERIGGWRASMALERRAGTHWLWQVDAQAVSPGFDVNDLGRITRTDLATAHASLTRRETTPRGWLRNWALTGEAASNWTFGGEQRRSVFELTVNTEWRNFWTTNMHIHVEPSSQDDRLTRGGPTLHFASFREIWMDIGGDSRKRIEWELRLFHTHRTDGTRNNSISIALGGGIGSRFRGEIRPSIAWNTDARQYVTALDDPAAATFGRRYVFSTLERRTLSSRLRATWALSPDMVFDVYAEPFASSGRYLSFGHLAAPSGAALVDYDDVETLGDGSRIARDGTGEWALPARDFRVISLRSNAVLRWEWRPGSMLFLVWQQNRADEERLGGAQVGDLLDAWSAPSEHRFAVKVSWWLGL